MLKWIASVVIFFGITTQASFGITSCEVDNPQQGHWVTRYLYDEREPVYSDRCNPPNGEDFRVTVSTQGCGFVGGESCAGCIDQMLCPIGNEIIDGALQPFCDNYIGTFFNCGVAPEMENGCCKVDSRGSNQCDEEVNWASVSFSQVAVQVLQWICYDQCPDDPNKTDPGECGCGNPDTDSDGDGTPDCADNNSQGPPPCPTN